MTPGSRRRAYLALVLLGIVIAIFGGDWWFVGAAIAFAAGLAALMTRDTLSSGDLP